MAEQEKNTKTEQQPGLEERFAALDAILEEMETDDVTLERSFVLYKQGVEQLKAANAALDAVEKEMLVLTEDGSLEEL